MILTGTEIIKELNKGNINIFPFMEAQVNPNSYNYRLGDKIKIIKVKTEKLVFKEVSIPSTGLLLKKNHTYLANTFEVIGSKRFAMSLIGKSSIGRLGLFLQISANLGHTTSNHKWTLELHPLMDFIVYPKMGIGQVSFWTNRGNPHKYNGVYGRYNNPQEYLV